MTKARTARRRHDGQPGYRMYVVRVARAERLGPSFVRLTFTGDSLREFGAGGADQRIKLLLPQPGRTIADIPHGEDWYPRWQAMPDDVRPTMRTYTVRAYRPEVAEIDVDFVLHGVDEGHGGPASRWAAAAAPGDIAVLCGPDRPGNGRMWGCEWLPPETARQVVLAGDETALPAVASIVESLPPDARGIVCVEVPTAGDVQWWRAPEGVEIRWSVRQRANRPTPHGSLLETALADALAELCEPARRAASSELDDVDVDTTLLWEVPEQRESVDATGGELYGWLAGEAAVIKRLRRMMVGDYGVPRGSVAFMGYWRQGRCN
ncbi:NADPH-dependent ferric siderophore reductase [Saccharopolyspora erythraea NRRL 2338]|uniref:Siderophore-interacting protein n=2 Tax=Saccharopolyspora erythraea TaxID=1836 RepID=A4FH23_SACEN|nr:siderophore-interacting protein [Saccharopolyspora erythraea]EQD82446.1 FAD-binding protein [Saccharopolyspora erythraea D]PFG97051.1 NADPH-dependent ferric siderophore reductase [Saccharopolyspora erythraea NRRL 2338]QRK87257.1 siderophore-interacting protein [Saccharopolyspora erythraea]CAM03348.1 siderophore-interacting protein [Saccharopolyspora erythraea NRRL 2338]